jgi:hypothetical protein
MPHQRWALFALLWACVSREMEDAVIHVQRLARGHVGRQRARRLSQEVLERRASQQAEAEAEVRRLAAAEAAAAAAAAAAEQEQRERAATEVQRIARGRLARASLKHHQAEAEALRLEREWLAEERARLGKVNRRVPATAPASGAEVEVVARHAPSPVKASSPPPVQAVAPSLAPPAGPPPEAAHDPAPDSAVVKIQSVVRGRQGRKKAIGVRVQHRAAIDVQRVVRGRQSRSRVAHLRSKVEALTSPPRTGLEPEPAPGPEVEQDECKAAMGEDEAALHIQRVARGGVARRKAARQAETRRAMERAAALREKQLEDALG